VITILEEIVLFCLAVVVCLLICLVGGLSILIAPEKKNEEPLRA
jgi:hypothetical protein